MSTVASVVVSVGSVTVTKLFSFLSLQLFVLSNSLLVSLVELPALDVPGGGVTAGLRTAPSQVRIILRDLSGKASWDASILYCSPEDSVCSHRIMEEETGMFAVKKKKSVALFTLWGVCSCHLILLTNSCHRLNFLGS